MSKKFDTFIVALVKLCEDHGVMIDNSNFLSVWDRGQAPVLDMEMLMDNTKREPEGCGAKLAPAQYWTFCGETDMGQTMAALCTECGGEYRRA